MSRCVGNPFDAGNQAEVLYGVFGEPHRGF